LSCLKKIDRAGEKTVYSSLQQRSITPPESVPAFTAESEGEPTMTMTNPKKGQSEVVQLRKAPAIEWTAVQSGLWVGKSNGEFAGMIEARWGEGFAATTRLARNLGIFTTVDEAKASFAEA
jgi:hypothetical protein